MAHARGTARHSFIFPGADMIRRNDSLFKDKLIDRSPDAVRPAVFRPETGSMRLHKEKNDVFSVIDEKDKKRYHIPVLT